MGKLPILWNSLDSVVLGMKWRQSLNLNFKLTVIWYWQNWEQWGHKIIMLGSILMILIPRSRSYLLLVEGYLNIWRSSTLKAYLGNWRINFCEIELSGNWICPDCKLRPSASSMCLHISSKGSDLMRADTSKAERADRADSSNRAERADSNRADNNRADKAGGGIPDSLSTRNHTASGLTSCLDLTCWTLLTNSLRILRLWSLQAWTRWRSRYTTWRWKKVWRPCKSTWWWA